MFIPLSGPSDYVLVSDHPDPLLLNHWDIAGFKFGTLLLEGDLLPSEELELVSWGDLVRLENSRLEVDPKKLEISKTINSKIYQWDLRKEESLLRGKIITSEDNLISELEDVHSPIVLKAEYGLAGRNQIVLGQTSESWKLSQIPKRLFGFPILMEEWVGDRRILDFSTLWDVENSKFRYLGNTVMAVDRDGTFRGIRIFKESNPLIETFLPKIYATVQSVSSKLTENYSGPCSVDGFFFRENTIQCQPISEFNFRYSIGRILWELKQKRNSKSNESGILILPYPKSESLDEWDWIQKQNDSLDGFLMFLTPARDSKKKPYQNVVLYYETNFADHFVEEILSVWPS